MAETDRHAKMKVRLTLLLALVLGLAESKMAAKVNRFQSILDDPDTSTVAFEASKKFATYAGEKAIGQPVSDRDACSEWAVRELAVTKPPADLTKNASQAEFVNRCLDEKRGSGVYPMLEKLAAETP